MMRDRSRSPIQIRAPSDRRVYVANIPFDMKWTELKDLFKSQCGDNSVSYVRYFEDNDGKFRGCGIVEFKDVEATRKALDKLHRYELNGRFLVVKEDYDVERDSTGRVILSGSSGGGGGSKGGSSRKDRDRSPPSSSRRDNRSPPPSRNDYAHAHSHSHAPPGGYNTYGLSPVFLDSLGIDLPLSNKLFVANLDYKVSEADLKRLFKLCGRVTDVELYVDKEGNSKGNALIEMEHPIESVQAISMLNRQVYHGRQLAIRMDRKEGEEPKLPPGLEGIGKGLAPGGLPLRLPKEFPPIGNSSNIQAPPVPPPVVAPPPAPVPPVTNPVAGLLGNNPNAAAGLAALTTALGALAGQTGAAGLLGGATAQLGLGGSGSRNSMRNHQTKYESRDDGSSNDGTGGGGYDDRSWRNWN